MAPTDPDKVLKKTVEQTLDIIADYIEPGERNAEETVEKVAETVDNDEVKEALEGKRTLSSQALEQKAGR